MVVKREYPEQPLVGVGGVVVSGGRVLLVRRAQEPLKGEWSIPGGLLELGEALEEGVQRELKEETGLRVEPVSVLGVFDRILYDKDAGRLKYHFVLVDYLCRVGSGEPRAGSDVSEVCWARREEVPAYHMNKKTEAVVEKAFQKAVEMGL